MVIRKFASGSAFLTHLRSTADQDFSLQESVREILREVRAEGDSAVLRFTEKFDGVRRSNLAVTAGEWRQQQKVAREELELLSQAAENIRAFHTAERAHLSSWRLKRPGFWLEQRMAPIRRVGVYVPGGKAAYPSSVLMNVIPAQVAGVPEVVLVSPPDRHTGTVHPLILAAARLLGIEEVYAAGGAQAVAALAFGTESLPPVDKITGPGNRYVNEAKRQVFGKVGIDALAGPSEVLVIADGTADPALVAADLLAQAEHDSDARAFCLSVNPALLEAVEKELERQLQMLPRNEIAAAALKEHGALVRVRSPEEAVQVANAAAPEHLELMTAAPETWLPEIRNAGSVFVGPMSPEPVGDYWAGSNHVLPTGGTARFSSGLSVRDFLRWTNIIGYSSEALFRDGKKIARLARLESLEGHARSVEIRLERLEGKTS